ncbi:MAG TPA: OmpA family protein [Arenicellales bacterium]|jgi:chemotaxis protein MotB|nr:OmpA family protein [Arenicellales bacterium]
MAQPVLLITSYLALAAVAAGGWGLYTIEQDTNEEGRQALADQARLVKQNQTLREEIEAHRQGEKELEQNMEGAAQSLKAVQSELDTIRQWAEERESAYAQGQLNTAKPEELEALTALLAEAPTDQQNDIVLSSSEQLTALLEKLKEQSAATESGIRKLEESQEKLESASLSVDRSVAITPKLLADLVALQSNVEQQGREVQYLQAVIAGVRSEASSSRWIEDLEIIEQELSAYQQRTEVAEGELQRLRGLFAIQGQAEVSRADDQTTSQSEQPDLSIPLGSALVSLKSRVAEDSATIERLTLLLESLRDQSTKTTNKASALESLIGELRDDQVSLKKLVAQLRTEKQTAEERLNQLEQEFRALTSTSNLEVHKLADQLTLIRVGGDLLFDTGETTIREEARVGLDLVAAAISGFPDRPLSIEGHTDNVPIADSLRRYFPTNWELSAARAASAARYLIAKGVDPSRITVVGWGEEQPISSNSADEGRMRNRRIEILLLPARKRQIRKLGSG